MIDLNGLIEVRQSDDYQRDNYDLFLKKSSFKYTVPSIHIAGTNGKGTTAHYLASIYQKAGYKVGLFSSPHFYEINELISINGVNISDSYIKKYISDNYKLLKKCDLSAFEIETLIAFNYFQDEKCDIAIIECGMGGEIDATNIFTPVLSIITSISLEHTMFLGRSISEIAAHKAGIIKEEVPVVIDEFDEEAMNVITESCIEKETTPFVVSIPNNVTFSDGYTFDYQTYNNIHINSLGDYSVKDACLALEGVFHLQNKFPVSDEAIYSGFASVDMPGRMEKVNDSPVVIIDGAHNPEAMEKLSSAITRISEGKNIHTLFACFKDKNFSKMLGIIGEISQEVILTTFDHVRARNYEDYFLFAEEHEYKEDAYEALQELMEKYPDDLILVTGSLAFAGYMRKMFKKD